MSCHHASEKYERAMYDVDAALVQIKALKDEFSRNVSEDGACCGGCDA